MFVNEFRDLLSSRKVVRASRVCLHDGLLARRHEYTVERLAVPRALKGQLQDQGKSTVESSSSGL